MTSSTSYPDDGTRKLPNTDGAQPTEQEVQESDSFSSPGRLGRTVAAAVTPDSADRASGGFRPIARSVSPEGPAEAGSSRLSELRSKRNSKLGALKERIKSSHDTLATSARSGDSGSEAKPEEDNIQIGNSANAENVDRTPSPTPRLDELRARRKERLEEIRSRSRSSSAEDAPPPFITRNGTDVQSKETSSNDDKKRQMDSSNRSAASEDEMKQKLAAMSDGTHGARGRRKGLRRRSSAPNLYTGISEAMLNDEMLSGLSKLDRLRLRRAQMQEKADLAKANVSRLEETSEDIDDDKSTMSYEIPRPSPWTKDTARSVSAGVLPGSSYVRKRRSSAPNAFEGISEEMLNDEMLSGLSELDRLRAQWANVSASRLTEEMIEEDSGEPSTILDEIPKPSPLTQESGRSVSAPGRRKALKRRSSAPNVYTGISGEMLNDEMLSGLSKLDRLRLRRAQIAEKAQLVNANVSRLTQEVSGEHAQQQMNDQTKKKQLEKQLHDVQQERAKLQRALEASRAALQQASGEKQSGAKTAAGADSDMFICGMIDEIQGQVDKLEEETMDVNNRLEGALHKERLEVVQLKNQLQETQFNLSQSMRENQELHHRNEQQQVRHSNVTKMWEHRTEGLVSQLRDLQYSLQDLRQVRLQERSDLLRHIVLLEKENQRLRNGGMDQENESPRTRFWKAGAASSFSNSLTFMPFGSLLGKRDRTVKATGDTRRPLKPADDSEGKSHSGVSTFLTRCTGLMTWNTAKNVAWGAGIMGVVLMSNDPHMTRDVGPFFRLELSA